MRKGEMRKRDGKERKLCPDRLIVLLASEWDISLITNSMCNILLYFLHNREERKITRNESL